MIPPKVASRSASTKASIHDESYLQDLLTYWGINNEPLVKVAKKIGGITKQPIFRVYSNIGSQQSFSKMSSLLEEYLVEKVITELTNTYLWSNINMIVENEK